MMPMVDPPSLARDVELVLESCEQYRDKPKELRAIFNAALYFAIRRYASADAFDKFVEIALKHPSLLEAARSVSGSISPAMSRKFRAALIESGNVMGAFELAARMLTPLTREEIVELGGNLGKSSEGVVSAAHLLDYAQFWKLPELDMRRLRTQIAALEGKRAPG